MRAQPPVHDVLLAEHPRLAACAVGDRRANLRSARSCVDVVPVVGFAGANAAREISQIMDGIGFGHVEMHAVAPVRQRPPRVDADEIDCRRGPNDIKREADFRAAVENMCAIFRPVRRIRNFRRLSQLALHVGRKLRQRLRRRIQARRRAHARQRRQLRTDKEGVDAARRYAKVSAMQDEATIGPFVGAWRLRTEELGDLRRRRRGRVHAVQLSGRGITGDMLAPRKRGLARLASPWIRQRIAVRYVHHQKRIEDDRQPARLQIPDRRDDAVVRRRAAVGRCAADLADEARAGAREAGDGPVRHDHWIEWPGQGLERIVYARRDGAFAGAQIVAEPGDDEPDASEIWTERLDRVDRPLPVAPGPRLGAIFVERRSPAGVARMRGRLITEFGRARNHIDRADHLCKPIDRAHDLEGELRHAIAESGERKTLEHDISEAAIGRHGSGLFDRRDQRVGFLHLIAAMDAHGHCGEIEFLTIRPDPPDEGDRPFAQTDREIGIIGIRHIDRGRLRRAACLAAISRDERDIGLLIKSRGPDHLPAQPRTPIEARHRRAFHGRDAGDPGQARTDMQARLRGSARLQQGASERACGLTDNRADRAGDEIANGRPNSGKEKRGHAESSGLSDAGKRKCARDPATPDTDRHFRDARAVVRMNHVRAVGRDADMLGDSVLPKAEHQQVAGPNGVHVGRAEMPFAQSNQRFETAGFGPVRGIGLHRLRFRADQFAP